MNPKPQRPPEATGPLPPPVAGPPAAPRRERRRTSAAPGPPAAQVNAPGTPGSLALPPLPAVGSSASEIPIPIVTISHSGRIHYVNAEARRFLEQPEARLAGLEFSSLLNPADTTRFLSHLESCTGEIRHFETSLRARGNEIVHVDLVCQAVRPPSPVRMITIVMLERGPVAELQRRNEEIEAFTHALTHELRAPIITIARYSALLAAHHAKNIPPAGLQMLDRIDALADQLLNVVARLVEFFSVAPGNITLQTVDLDTFIDRMLEHFLAQPDWRQVDIVVRHPLPAVRASPLLLYCALSNVLGNALKFSSSHKRPQVIISAHGDRGHVVIDVKDNGIGLDPGDCERVFGLFYRTQAGTSFPGAGIGLAIARRAMEQMQGRISARNRRRGGCCFSLELMAG